MIFVGQAGKKFSTSATPDFAVAQSSLGGVGSGRLFSRRATFQHFNQKPGVPEPPTLLPFAMLIRSPSSHLRELSNEHSDDIVELCLDSPFFGWLVLRGDDAHLRRMDRQMVVLAKADR